MIPKLVMTKISLFSMNFEFLSTRNQIKNLQMIFLIECFFLKMTSKFFVSKIVSHLESSKMILA